MIVALPDSLAMRAPTMDDAEAVTELANTCIQTERETPPLTAEEIRYVWQIPRFNLAADAWAVATPEGKLVGYANVFQREEREFYFEGFVHPDYRGQGIGTCLLRLVEARVRQQMSPTSGGADAPISLKTSFGHKNDTARQLVEQEGYRLVRHTWEMKIEMDSAPSAPIWPDGITARTFLPDQDLGPVSSAIEEAFQDHWNHTPKPFDEWQQRVKREGFDPSLRFIAWDGKEIAGAALCRYHSGNAWVSQLAARRLWRRKGLGLALLRHAFGEFYRRGDRQVTLTVDSQNPTGAARLYEQAGMRVDWQYDLYEKELRPGTA